MDLTFDRNVAETKMELWPIPQAGLPQTRVLWGVTDD